MSDKILNALMQLFALIATPAKSKEVRESVVFNFLKEKLNTELANKYLAVYNEYFKKYQERQSKTKKNKFIAVSSVKVLAICTLLNKELTQKEKYIVLIRLLEFIKTETNVSDQVNEFLSAVAETFHIPNQDFEAIRRFVFKDENFCKDYKDNTLVISSKTPQEQGLKYILAPGLKGKIVVFFIDRVKMHIFFFNGEKELFLNQHLLSPDTVYIFSYGSSIRTPRIRPIYYSDIISAYTFAKIKRYVTFEADRISYKFPNGRIGIHELSFIERSGKLVGIMGASGSGKTTLLNLLNGNYEPTTGQVLINGLNLHQDKEKLHGIIGYVPQEDFLIEELTVFENLYFNAKLSFGDYSDFRIIKEVIKLLKDLGLYEIKDNVVGSPLNRKISGGQRKRLNIALELIRKPPVLFLDEPTSGLSSSDSENIMDLLKELTLQGKLVFVVIHQPSSDIYKMFDRVMILDHGGYLIYNGPPIEAISYFKSSVRQADWSDSECPVCGTVKSEEIFKIVEAKVLDEFGRPTQMRKITPREWYLNFKQYDKNKRKFYLVRDLPEIPFNIPSFFKQFKIFVARDVLAKFSNVTYVLLNLLETPILAIILSFIIRYWDITKHDGQYLLFFNDNLPIYLFMSVIIAVFVGLTVSAQEIIKDREIRQREAFLNLSRGGYLLSKVFILFFLSAFQSFIYVLVGNSIMGIHEMFWKYWLILFSVWFSGNLMGLNISDAFKSTVAIYITIPFLIIPQIILSGVLVPFDKLNPKISSPVTIPWYGEIMSAKWAYEGLAVIQYRDNSYKKLFYDYEKKLSEAAYVKDFWAKTLLNTIYEIQRDLRNNQKPDKDNVLLLRNELSANHPWNNIYVQNFKISNITVDKINNTVLDSVKLYLNAIQDYYRKIYNEVSEEKNTFIYKITKEKGGDYLTKLKYNYHNDKLEEFVTNWGNNRIIEYKHHLYRKYKPIYFDGEGLLFKSHFYSPRKKIFGYYLDTFWANILVLWIQTGLLFVMLYYRVIYKLLNSMDILFSRIKLRFSDTGRHKTRSKFTRWLIKTFTG